MIEINSKQELYEYLKQFDWKEKQETEFSSVYFLVDYENMVEPVYFHHFDDWWLEYPCSLMHIPLKEDELISYVKECYEEAVFDKAYAYEKMMYRDGILYEIENFQCEPFLPEKFRIIKAMSETECLDWILKHVND